MRTLHGKRKVHRNAAVGSSYLAILPSLNKLWIRPPPPQKKPPRRVHVALHKCSSTNMQSSTNSIIHMQNLDPDLWNLNANLHEIPRAVQLSLT